jgi:asparagine synthase (glutamine-hydrolysing)
MPGIVGIAPANSLSIEDMARSISYKKWHLSATRSGWGALGCVSNFEPRCVLDQEKKKFGFLYGRPYEKEQSKHFTLIGPERCMELYSKKGPEAFADIDGTFIFALCDDQARNITVITDKYGHRPVYYKLEYAQLRFSSEIKALLPKGELLRLDKIGLAEHLLFGGAIGERTLYQDIKALPPASILRYDGSTLNISQY